MSDHSPTPDGRPKTCRRCRFWQRNEESEWSSYSSVFGLCGCARLAYGRTNGRKGTGSFAIKTDAAFSDDEYPHGHGRQWAKDVSVGDLADMLLYEDHSGYAAELQTGRDFGCIHWEPRDEARKGNGP